MAGSTFQTNPFDLHKLLDDCHRGVIQLPDFQRSWVWDEDRIKSLIASVSRAFPVGALMSLESGGPVNFKPRPIEGAPDEAKLAAPRSLLLDGQQRMTSLYQVTLRNKVVETVTPKKKKVKRWFYIDIRKALDESMDREAAIIGVPEDRIVRADFGREVVLDLSSTEQEYASLMYPVSQVFDWDRWQDGFDKHWRGDHNETIRDEFRAFKNRVLKNFESYRVPVITLDQSTSEGSRLRRLREGKHRRQAARRIRTGYRNVRSFRPRTSKGLVRRCRDEGTASPSRGDTPPSRPRYRQHRRSLQHRLPSSDFSLPHA